jgi:basic amino acid/polyamine antiporter, APA family
VIYVLVNVALLQVLTPAEMGGSPLAAGDAARRVFGQHADTIVTALSLVSLFTILNMALMTLSRVLYVIARDAGVPYLSQVAENGTPIVAACVMVVAEALLAVVGVYAVLLAFSTWLMTGVAATVNLAAIRMRRSKPALERPYRMPGFPLPAILALVVNATLLAAFLYESPLTVLRATALLAVVTGAVAVATRRSAGPPVKVAFDAGA